MSGQEEREDGLTGGIVCRTGRMKRKLTIGWKGAMTGQEETETELPGRIGIRTEKET
jgi:hypothetical protein